MDRQANHSELSGSFSPDVAGEARPVIVVSPAGGSSQTVWWVLTVVVAMLGTMWVMRQDDLAMMRSASAQPAGGQFGGAGQAGGRGIYAFTGQLTSRTFGLFMMDVDTGTIWCYEIRQGVTNEPMLKLVAARSWIYDRYLEEFNVAEPVPGTIRDLVAQQRSHRDSQGDGKGDGKE